MTHCLPLPAVSGLDAAREALTFLAVDPGLRGVLIAGPAGTGKSTLVRAFECLLPRPFVEVPASTGPDQLDSGLLARARCGVLYVDEINLLDRGALQQILGESGCSLIGTYDPREGEICPALLDSVAIHVRETGLPPAGQRLDVLRSAAALEIDPAGFAAGFKAQQAAIERRCAEARTRLPHVAIRTGDRRRLIEMALQLGIEGNRTDLFALRAARVSAALRGAARVEEQDLKAAVELVLLKFVERPTERQLVRSEIEGRLVEQEEAPAGAPPAEDLLVPALEDGQPPDFDLPRVAGKGRSPEARLSKQLRGVACWSHGRYVRAVAHAPKGAKIAVEATLRAAASRPRACGIEAVRVRPEDLRFKQYSRKAGMLHIFVVDASGSMALNRIGHAKGAILRLLERAYLHRDTVALISFRGDRAEVLLPPTRSVELAKRALDMLPVGGGTPMTAALSAARDLARRARLSGLPQALLVLFTDGRPNVATTPGADPWRELETVCGALRSDGTPAIVIDTNHRAAPGGGVERLAALLGGTWLRLPNAGSGDISGAIAGFSNSARMP